MQTGASEAAEGCSAAARSGLGKEHTLDAFESGCNPEDDDDTDACDASIVAYGIGKLFVSNDRFANGAASDRSRKNRIKRGRHCAMN